MTLRTAEESQDEKRRKAITDMLERDSIRRITRRIASANEPAKEGE